MSELWEDLICIPLVLSSSLQSPEQSIVSLSSETSSAPPISDIWWIILQNVLVSLSIFVMKYLANCVPVLFLSFFLPLLFR